MDAINFAGFPFPRSFPNPEGKLSIRSNLFLCKRLSASFPENVEKVTLKNVDPSSLLIKPLDSGVRSLSIMQSLTFLISKVTAGTSISICAIGTMKIALDMNLFRKI